MSFRIIVTLAILLAVQCLGLSTIPAQTYFFDDFDDGNAVDGNPVTWVPDYGVFGEGTREVVDGHFTVTPGNQTPPYPHLSRNYYEASSRVDSAIFANGVLRTTARPLTGGVSLFGIFARDTYTQDEEGTSIYANFRTDSRRLTIGHLIDGNPIDLATVETNIDTRNTNINLEFFLDGGVAGLTGWADGTEKPSIPQVLVQDLPSTVSSEGGFGLSTGHVWREGQDEIPVAFDYFSALPTIAPFGDFDFDGEYTIEDYDALYKEVNDRSNHPLYDVTHDGNVDTHDAVTWRDLAGAANGFSEAVLLGDTNLDGQVNSTDLNNLGVNWQSTDATSWSQGDFNIDGRVDAEDLNLLGINWQRDIAINAASVPEPCSAALIIAIVSVICLCRLP